MARKESVFDLITREATTVYVPKGMADQIVSEELQRKCVRSAGLEFFHSAENAIVELKKVLGNNAIEALEIVYAW